MIGIVICNMQNYEGYYFSVVYTFFSAMGLNLIPEDNTSRGQIDLTILLPDKIFIIEFKMINNTNAANALVQIKNKDYQEKYTTQNKAIYLIGITFDATNRNISDYKWEALQ